MTPAEHSVEAPTAIVTGAARGLGQGIARVIAEAGAKVMVAALGRVHARPNHGAVEGR